MLLLIYFFIQLFLFFFLSNFHSYHNDFHNSLVLNSSSIFFYFFLLTSYGVNSLFIFLFTLNILCLPQAYTVIFLSIFDRNANYIFWWFYVTFLSYFLLISLFNLTISKLLCKYLIKRKTIFQKYFLGGIYYSPKTHFLNFIDRENDNSQYFNIKIILQRKNAKEYYCKYIKKR